MIVLDLSVIEVIFFLVIVLYCLFVWIMIIVKVIDVRVFIVLYFWISFVRNGKFLKVLLIFVEVLCGVLMIVVGWMSEVIIKILIIVSKKGVRYLLIWFIIWLGLIVKK